MRHARNVLTLTAFGFMYLFFISCGKEIPCNEAKASLNFIAFPDSETDTLIVKRFAKATNFTSLIDTFFINKLNSGYVLSTDTLQIGNTFSGDNGLKSKYDYEIYLPQTNRVFKITEIWEEIRSTSGGGLFSLDAKGCSNFIKSYKVNGQLISGTPNYTKFYFRP